MRRYFPLVLLLLLTAACAAQPAKAVTSIAVVINDTGYTPAKWRIPGGELITIRLTNASAQEHEWVLLKEPPGESYGPEDEANVLYRVTLAAGETRSAQFKAPTAPGEYSATCSKPGHLEKGETGLVLVVQPGY